MRIVSRAEWGARPPKARYTMRLPSPRLWVHHTASWQSIEAIQAFHMDSRGWSDIAYSFLVDKNGVVYEGRGAGVVGGHTRGDNSSSHAICAMGNYDTTQPPEPMVASVADLARHGREKGWWGELTGGHRDAPGASTACPGRYLYARIPELRTYTEDDMPLNEADVKKINEIVAYQVTRILRMAVGPDDAKTPAGKYFGRIEDKLDALEASGATGGLSDSDVASVAERVWLHLKGKL